jgi:hypothetical protein
MTATSQRLDGRLFAEPAGQPASSEKQSHKMHSVKAVVHHHIRSFDWPAGQSVCLPARLLASLALTTRHVA